MRQSLHGTVPLGMHLSQTMSLSLLPLCHRKCVSDRECVPIYSNCLVDECQAARCNSPPPLLLKHIFPIVDVFFNPLASVEACRQISFVRVLIACQGSRSIPFRTLSQFEKIISNICLWYRNGIGLNCWSACLK